MIYLIIFHLKMLVDIVLFLPAFDNFLKKVKKV